eukprot:m.1323980 g.1323980  ORF g.1323980 m.1323980 type:complete len:608 (-) comp24851_c0_seq32:4501-6324(-)
MKKSIRRAVAGLTGERPLDLDEHDEKAELEVQTLKHAFTSLSKSLEEAHPHLEDPAKQMKKVPQHAVGSKMMASAMESFTGVDSTNSVSGFGQLYKMIARIQLNLGQLESDHHKNVFDKVIEKLNDALETSSAVVASSRKKVMAAKSELESSRKKYDQLRGKLDQKKGDKDLQSKCDAAGATFEASQAEMKKVLEGYSVALSSFLDQDRQLGSPMVDLINEQMNYHRTSLMILEQIKPKIDSVYHEMGTKEGRMFGGAIADKGVSPVLLQCCACIARDGMDAEGIFRRAGATSQIRSLRAAFSKGQADLSSPSGYSGDIHAVAAIVKMYFRELMEPLLLSSLYDQWIASIYIEDHNEKLYEMQRVLQQLPEGHQETLRFICKFLSEVAKVEGNKMDLHNLSIVFGPNFLWSPGSDGGGMAEDSANLAIVAELLLTYADWFFPKEDGERDPLDTSAADATGPAFGTDETDMAPGLGEAEEGATMSGADGDSQRTRSDAMSVEVPTVPRRAKRDKAGGSSLSEAESADGAMQPPRRTAPRPDSFGGSPTASSTKARPTSMTSPGPALPLGAKPALVPAGTTTADTDTKAGGVTSPGPPRPAGPKPPMRN